MVTWPIVGGDYDGSVQQNDLAGFDVSCGHHKPANFGIFRDSEVEV